VLFDLLKIRRHLDEAIPLAVRAASGGSGPGGGDRELSPKGKHCIRKLAVLELAKAYKLDETAASAATLSSSTTLEDVAGLVLERKEKNEDTKTEVEYVHFFHEKVPCVGDLSHLMRPPYTSLAPLDRLIDARPHEAAPLRTRASTKSLQKDFQGAVADLTKALQLLQSHDSTTPPTPKPGQNLRDAEMPSSLEGQLFFHRACAYLSLALQAVEKAFATRSAADTSDNRKTVRKYVNHAMNDYYKFLDGLEYAPSTQGKEVVTVSQLITTAAKAAEDQPDETEALTYHPLLTEALYSMLLCHLLLATPREELERYVAVVNLLTRIADLAVPTLLLAAVCRARAVWSAVVKDAKLNLELVATVRRSEYPISIEVTRQARLLVRWVGEGWGGIVAAQKKRKKKKKNAEVLLPVEEVGTLTLQ
jgi:hypothetical protein